MNAVVLLCFLDSQPSKWIQNIYFIQKQHSSLHSLSDWWHGSVVREFSSEHIDLFLVMQGADKQKESFVLRSSFSTMVNSKIRLWHLIVCDHLWCSCFPVEDQKELPSPVNPELRHKEVQMNFFNQLTSVFNPDISVLASPSAHMQVSEPDQSIAVLFSY